MVCLSRPYLFKFFEGCIPQSLLGPFLNTLFQMKIIPIAQLNQQIYNFRYFGNEWSYPTKLTVSTCRKVWCSSASRKSTSCLRSFLRYFKDNANMSCWVLSACLVMNTKNDGISLYKTFMYKFKQKSKFYLTSLLSAKILQICYYG